MPTRHLFLTLIVSSCIAIASSASGQSSDPAFQIFTGPRSIDGSSASAGEESSADPIATLAAAIMERAGFTYTLSVTNWSRAVQTLQSTPNVMVYSMIRNPERENQYHWIGQIRPIETWLFALAGKLDNPPRSLDAAKAFRIGAARSSASAEFLDNNGFADINYIGDFTRAALMLQRERIDLAAFSLPEARSLEEAEGMAPGSLIPLVRIDALSSGTYFVVSMQTDPHVVRRLREAYQALVENGDYERILDALPVANQ